MAYRDDREALLARVAALETELDAQGGETSRQQLRADLDALAARVAAASGALEHDHATLAEVGQAIDRLRLKLNPGLPGSPPPPPPPAPAFGWTAPLKPQVWIGVLGAALVLGVGIGAWLYLHMTPKDHRPTASAPENRPHPARFCHLYSSPSGAEVLAAAPGGTRELLGSTPFEFTGVDAERELTLRLDGYRESEVPPSTACRIDVTLEREGH